MFPLHSSSHFGKDVRRFAETLADPNKRLQRTESVKHPELNFCARVKPRHLSQTCNEPEDAPSFYIPLIPGVEGFPLPV